MRQPVSFLTQSRFYSPAFNAAIFDGPIRIYFAQYQEALALKIYFELQENLKELYFDARESFKKNGAHIFLMLYPTGETFNLSFDKQLAPVVIDRLENDYVVGVCGPTEEKDTELVLKSMEVVIREIKVAKQIVAASDAEADFGEAVSDDITLAQDLKVEI